MLSRQRDQFVFIRKPLFVNWNGSRAKSRYLWTVSKSRIGRANPRTAVGDTFRHSCDHGHVATSQRRRVVHSESTT